MKAKKQVARRSPLTDDEKELMMATLIRNPIAFQQVKNILKPEHFDEYDAVNGVVWMAVSAHWDKYQELPSQEFLKAGVANVIKSDPGLVTDEEESNLDDFLITAFDNNKNDGPKSAAWTRNTMQKFMEDHLARRVQSEIVSAQGRIPENLAEMLSQASTEAAQIAAVKDDKIRSFGDDWEEHQERLKPYRGKKLIGLKTGLEELDRRTLGLRGFMVIGAKPGMGKTALCLEMALGVCRNFAHNDAAVVYLSLDMPKFELYARIESNLARIPWNVLMFGSQDESGGVFNDDHIELLAKGHQRFKHEQIDKRMTIVDRSVVGDALTADRLAAILAECKARCQAKRALLVTDYLQLLPTPEEIAGRGDLQADKYRIRLIQQAIERTMTPDNPTGDAVVAISEARKPANSKDGWGETMSELMGSARLGYAVDAAMLYRPMSRAEMQIYYHSGYPFDKSVIEDHRKALEKEGIVPLMLILDKGRQGMVRGPWGVEFHFRMCQFKEIKPSKGTYKTKDVVQPHLKNLAPPEVLAAAKIASPLPAVPPAGFGGNKKGKGSSPHSPGTMSKSNGKKGTKPADSENTMTTNASGKKNHAKKQPK